MAERILLVEDEEKLARMVELELQYEGYEVEKAFDGRAGLDRALSGEFDLVLLDIMLPALSGMEVLRRLRRGDPSAREELMDRDMGFACGLAGSVLRGRPRDAEEVVSDAFLALWEHAGQVEPGKLRPWLGRVVRNKALNRLRALGGELPLEEDWLALEPDRRPGPAEAVEQAERAELIRALLNGLPPQDRAIFLRHYYYGQTAADIGAALAMPPSTVKVRLHRGRRKLKELLMERGYSCACADD